MDPNHPNYRNRYQQNANYEQNPNSQQNSNYEQNPNSQQNSNYQQQLADQRVQTILCNMVDLMILEWNDIWSTWFNIFGKLITSLLMTIEDLNYCNILFKINCMVICVFFKLIIITIF